MDGTTEIRRDARQRLDQRRWEQRVGAFTAIPELLRQLGADPAQVLASAGLSPDALCSAERRIPYGAWGRLLERSAAATGQRHFGLLAGRMWRLEDLGIVGEAVRNCATVGEALQALTAYQQLNSAGGLGFMTKCAAIVDIGYAIYYPGIEGADQVFDCVLAGAFNFLREIAGTRWLPTEVFLPHQRPDDAIHYRTLFKVTPRFDSEICAIRFPAYWLDRPVEGADPARRRAAVQRIEETTQPQLLQQAMRALRLLLLSGNSSGDNLADMLAMHRRTLNRRLRAEGTTFQQVLDDVRFEAARQLLAVSDLALDDVAAAIGYAGISPFMRTFRRWSGMTPGEWRRRAHRARSEFSPEEIVPLLAKASPATNAAPRCEWLAGRQHIEFGDRKRPNEASRLDVGATPIHRARHRALLDAPKRRA
jgi:AraC-like DNA-binding protein